jgi:hypothetical protein
LFVTVRSAEQKNRISITRFPVALLTRNVLLIVETDDERAHLTKQPRMRPAGLRLQASGT